ncbi:siderophore-interacting protein [Roseomonas sp. OT10]|uniref:siderophore-interacting protein n=1 Tax=Roseomonas cutis TaxID=2897332 RepID=UPI001E2C4D17|nr:siderophore-interacting protein [Roseomonas sp. OT10]UFN50053.1 siderophore-interacting protein [Roseomonas sp. OT10]
MPDASGPSPPAPPPAPPPWAARWRGIRRLEVLRTARITRHLMRVTLGGEEFAGLRGGPNLKLILPPRANIPLELPGKAPDGKPLWAEGERRPAVRTYTVRRLDEAAGEMDIDFVLHGDEGVAGPWAARARPGDAAGVAALGGRAVRPADWTLLAGDHTALPAIAAILEGLPPGARGEAIIEVPDAAEALPLAHPPGMRLRWIFQDGREPGTGTALQDAVRAADWPAVGTPFVWVGAESIAAREIRAHVRDERGLDRRQMLVIGYWKRGMSETEYGAKLDHDRDEDYHRVAREEEAASHHHRHAPGHDHAH